MTLHKRKKPKYHGNSFEDATLHKEEAQDHSVIKKYFFGILLFPEDTIGIFWAFGAKSAKLEIAVMLLENVGVYLCNEEKCFEKIN